MPGVGFGSGTRPTSRGSLVRLAGPAAILPSAEWTGVPGSGFPVAPADPVRTSAKPAVRLVVPPDQYFTDELLIGVYAGANNNGSLLSNMGLQKVIVHYEGSAIDIAAPSVATFADANGIERSYFGWWVRLRHDGRDGHAQVYFEAVPSDPAMQRRVIGPYQFSPQRMLHDHRVEVAASSDEVAGARYRTLASALSYLASVGAENPLVTITEGGTYNITTPTAVAAGYAGAGYCTVVASAPVVFARPGFVSDNANRIVLRHDRMCFRGANVSFDMKFISQVFNHGNGDHWFDGINFTHSDGPYSLWRGGTRPVGYAVRGAPWFTECDCGYSSHPARNASLVRGCHFHDGFYDVVSDSLCVIGCTGDNWDSTQGWHVDVDSFTVGYSGPEETATIELSGGNADPARTFTARWGENGASFTVYNSEAAWSAGTNYLPGNVVDWLNSLGAGFTATLLDDTRKAVHLGLPGSKGAAVPPTDVKGKSVLFVTDIDVHADFYQQSNFVGPAENVIVADNTFTNITGQTIFLTSNNNAKDFLILNNAFYNRMVPSGYVLNADVSSQVQNNHSHVVIAHNTWASQSFRLRTDGSYNPDAACLFANNAVRAVDWLGPPDPDLAIRDNHLQGTSFAPPGAQATTLGGDEKDQFADAPRGDFTPTGALRANPKPPVLAYDARCGTRGPVAPAGAFA